MKDESVFADLTARETVPDKRCSIRKTPGTKRVHARTGKTKEWQNPKKSVAGRLVCKL